MMEESRVELCKDNWEELQQRIEGVCAVGSWQNNDKEGIRMCKKDPV
jgi:hypothetical protein